MKARSASTSARRRRRPEEAEREILEAAEALLRTRPSHEVTIAAVMARTGMTREAFYAYFRNRYELITRVVAPLRAQLDEQVAIPGAGPSLLGVATLYVEHGPLLRALAEASSRDPEARRAWHAFVEPAVQAICEQLRGKFAAEQLAAFDDLEAYVRILVGMNLACFFEELVDRRDADVELVVERLNTIWGRTFPGLVEPPEPGGED